MEHGNGHLRILIKRIMDKIVIFWNGWEPIIRILIVGIITYAGVIFLLRVSGKRTLASMNAFDFIVTVALGSTFGRILTAKQVSVSEAVFSFLLLISLQYIVSFIEVRSSWFHRLITSQPSLLYYNGNFLEKNIRKDRLQKKDLLGALRNKNISSLNEVEAIILETNGTISVIKKTKLNENSSYQELLT